VDGIREPSRSDRQQKGNLRRRQHSSPEGLRNVKVLQYAMEQFRNFVEAHDNVMGDGLQDGFPR
jgi:hypothetical protein